ncbi:MAG TPA: ABC transporter permease [Clostridia bacterium]|nr:ABC transporter permease [Clostridia bacterium]
MRKTSGVSAIINFPYSIWSIIFIIAPFAMVAYYAFTNRAGDFTLDNIYALKNYWETFLRSILFALVSTVVCLVISYPLAYIVAKTKTSFQRNIVLLIMIPMWMNLLIRTYSWITILSTNGLINNFLANFGIGPLNLLNTPFAVILGMVYNFLPYMILPIYSIMSKLDFTLIEASQDLGASSMEVIKKVIFPLSLPGVVSGITMVFVPCVSTFYISQMLGGGKILLIGDSIETQFQSAYNYNLGASLSLVLMVLIIISMALMNKFSDNEGELII